AINRLYSSLFITFLLLFPHISLSLSPHPTASRREEVDVRDKGIGSERKANRKGTRRDDIQSQPQPHLPASPQLRRTYSGATQMESRGERYVGGERGRDGMSLDSYHRTSEDLTK
ncbi:hypothetical protein BJ165DRAFT_1493793, partial [Panaeolus papilionaceus]